MTAPRGECVAPSLRSGNFLAELFILALAPPSKCKELPTIAKNIKKYRDKLGIFQDKLSKMAGVTLHTIAKIETGSTPDPRIETVKKIAQALKITLDDLIK